MRGDGGGSKLLVLVLVLLAGAVAIGLRAVARGRDVQVMNTELCAVIAQCHGKYREATSAADTARIDAWVPARSGGSGAGDPPCGRYRRRNML